MDIVAKCPQLGELAIMDIMTTSDVARLKHIPKLTAWPTSPRMDHCSFAARNMWRVLSSFTRCIRQESVVSLGSKWQCRSCGTLGPEWKRNMGLHSDTGQREMIQSAASYGRTTVRFRLIRRHTYLGFLDQPQK